MNVMDLSYEELLGVLEEKSKALEIAQQEYYSASSNLREKKRLEKLKASLGNVNAEDIAKVIESITLSAGSIESQENVQS